MTHWIRYGSLLLKGFFMGAANVIPGVSGGTIAFITGIYEKLIDSIHSVDGGAVKLFLKGEWKELYHRLNGGFLLALFVGILLATLTLAEVMQYFLEHHETSLWAFFFGLILASAIVILRRNKSWTTGTVSFLIVGAAMGYLITTLTMIQTPNTWPYLLITGAIAITTMILPGVSGSYVLVILDKYNYVIGLVAGVNDGLKNSVTALFQGKWSQIPAAWAPVELFPLFIFALGTVVGLVAFAKLLNYFLKHFYDLTITFLTGFMIGSLNKIWPWKKTIEWYTPADGARKPLEQVNVLPAQYDGTFFMALSFAVIGFIAVYLIEFSAQSQGTPSTTDE